MSGGPTPSALPKAASIAGQTAARRGGFFRRVWMNATTRRDDNGGWVGKLHVSLLAVIAASLLAGIGFMVKSVFHNTIGLAELRQHTAACQGLTGRVETMLKIDTDHGTQLNTIREDLVQIRGQLAATSKAAVDREKMFVGLLDQKTADRFTNKDWEREKTVIDLMHADHERRVTVLETQLTGIQRRLDEMQAGIDKIVVATVGEDTDGDN